MNLFKRKMHLFCISNIMVSFVCTTFLGTNYCAAPLESGQTISNEEVALVDDVIPLSQKESKEEAVTKETKTTTKKTTKTTSKNTSKAKKTVSQVTSKEVKASVTYAPAKYNEVTGSAIVDYAKRYLGLRYVSGGFSLKSGTDCSGFTKLIYKEFGITLSRVVSGQINSGTYVRKSDLQKGDLVFYSSGGSKATHVAIYVGGGSVIHESNHRDGVKYSSVNMMHYITARRVINATANKIAEEKIKNESNEVINTPTPEPKVTEQVVTTDTNNVQEEVKEPVVTPVVENEPKVETPVSNEPTQETVSEPVVENKNMDEKKEEIKIEATTPVTPTVDEVTSEN